MSSPISESTTASFHTMSSFDGQDIWPGSSIDQELLSDSTGRSIPQVTTEYNPGWTALDHGNEAGPWYSYNTPVKIEAQPVPIELGPTFNFTPTETHGTGEHGTAQKTRPRPRKRTIMLGGVQPVCVDCNRPFSRRQELNRHLIDKHQPPRQCPFCDLMWTRPDKIKTHVVAKHQDRLSPGMLANIKPLTGRQIVAFVDGFITDPYDQGLGVEATFPSLVPQGFFPVLM